MVGVSVFAELGGSHLHARAHARGDCDGLDELTALDRSVLGLPDGFENRGGVFEDLRGGPGRLADASANVGCRVHLAFPTAGLHRLAASGDIIGDRARLRIRYHPLWAEYPRERA